MEDNFNKISSFSEFINETKMSRLWQHIINRTPFGIVSASRSDMSEKEKKHANLLLRHWVRSLKFGYIELKGGYTEKGKDFAEELSLFIPNIKKDDIIKLGQLNFGYGPQDSVLYCDGKDFLGYLNTSELLGKIGDITMTFKYDVSHDALPMSKKAIGQFFSMLAKGSHKNRKFAFIPENVRLYEMRQRRTPHKPGDWWDNFGIRIL